MSVTGAVSLPKCGEVWPTPPPPPVNSQTLVKTLPSPAVGNYACTIQVSVCPFCYSAYSLNEGMQRIWGNVLAVLWYLVGQPPYLFISDVILRSSMWRNVTLHDVNRTGTAQSVERSFAARYVPVSSPTNAWSQVCGRDRLSCNTDCQNVSRCCTRGESPEVQKQVSRD